jgi:hypothetical protein
MAKRKKRLKKGIESLNKQIEIHKLKQEKAKEEGNIERVGYYEKEITRLENDRDKKEDLFEKN